MEIIMKIKYVLVLLVLAFAPQILSKQTDTNTTATIDEKQAEYILNLEAKIQELKAQQQKQLDDNKQIVAISQRGRNVDLSWGEIVSDECSEYFRQVVQSGIRVAITVGIIGSASMLAVLSHQ